jgi:magnesium-transporting ATPase (P-type)
MPPRRRSSSSGPPGSAFPWCSSVKQVQQELKVDSSVGLSSSEVEARRALFGANELAKEPPTPLWKLIAEQFDDTLVKVRSSAEGTAVFLMQREPSWLTGPPLSNLACRSC